MEYGVTQDTLMQALVDRHRCSIEKRGVDFHKPVPSNEFAFKYNTPVDKILSNSNIMQKTTKNGIHINGNYDSVFVQSRIKQIAPDLTEKDVLQGITKVDGDFVTKKGTTLTSTADIKVITGNLYVDAESALREFPNLKLVKGSLVVKAKDKKAASQYLKDTGLDAVKIGIGVGCDCV